MQNARRLRWLLAAKPDEDRGQDCDHFIIALLTFGIAAEVFAAAAILIFWGRASVLSVWSQQFEPDNVDAKTLGAVKQIGIDGAAK